MIMFESVISETLTFRNPSAGQFHTVTLTHRLSVPGKRLRPCNESYLQPQQPSLHTESHGLGERRRTSDREDRCICMRRRRAISVTSNQ